MTGSFWKGRRVFVTGHTGFKGSWLCLWLQRLGAEVTGYALPPHTDPSLFVLAGVARGMESREGNVLDLPGLAATLEEARPEIVLHLAAQALVRESYRRPVDTFAANVLGTVNLLEAVRCADGVKAVVVVSSDKCYENREWPWGYRENEPMGGHDPYSASKGCTELVTASYRSSFFTAGRDGGIGTACASARAGNVVGGGDWAADRLVPDILRAVEAGREAVIRSPRALRPWQHVLEPLSGYLLLAQALCEQGAPFAQAWNFGPWDADIRPVSWIAERLTAGWGDGASWRIDPAGADLHEASCLKLDSSKARKELGWRPRWPLERCVESVVRWHRARRSGADMRAFTLEQIESYEGTLVPSHEKALV